MRATLIVSLPAAWAERLMARPVTAAVAARRAVSARNVRRDGRRIWIAEAPS